MTWTNCLLMFPALKFVTGFTWLQTEMIVVHCFGKQNQTMNVWSYDYMCACETSCCCSSSSSVVLALTFCCDASHCNQEQRGTLLRSVLQQRQMQDAFLCPCLALWHTARAPQTGCCSQTSAHGGRMGSPTRTRIQFAEAKPLLWTALI